ncbi:hypothetical protein SAMN04487996_11768 [Dyadobacter soli]|uniref:Uncharacterized protein n=1 Tax=Dyadobacter soli TaxID=659014 RepID=A0A1G7T2J6_9BACT|nr:hypothetical protein SAMN04487996_11768 [Dyadobacter soli]
MIEFGFNSNIFRIKFSHLSISIQSYVIYYMINNELILSLRLKKVSAA